MKINWQSGEKNLPIGRVVDLDTGLPISNSDRACVFVDEESGEYRCIVKRDGRFAVGPDGKLLVETFHGRVKFFPFRGGSNEEFMEYIKSVLGIPRTLSM